MTTMRTIKNIINLIFLVLGYLTPRHREKIVFGAWEGRSYSDNPRFLFEFFFAHPEWRIVWIGHKATEGTLPILPTHASFAIRHSVKGMWHALTAKTWIFSHSTNDISVVAIWGKALLLDVGHGVALKKVGRQSVAFNMQNSAKGKSSLMSTFWNKVFANKTFLVVPSHIQGTNTINSYPNAFQEPPLPYGSPSLDYILQNKNNRLLITELRAKIAAVFNLPIDKKWIVYAPTFRLTTKNNFSFLDVSPTDKIKLIDVLRKTKSVIIEKLHPSLISTNKRKNDSEIYSLTGKAAILVDPQELWLAADALISDYSSCVIPFYLQKKPVIHFTYDYDFYTESDSGLIDDLLNIRFGKIANNLNELCDILRNMDKATNNCGKSAQALIEYEKGNACNQCARFIITHHHST